MIRHYLRAMGAAFKLTFLSLVLDGVLVCTTFLAPLIYAIIAFWVLAARGGSYGIYVAIGAGLAGLWSTLLFGSGNAITSERWTGTLEIVAATPTPLWLVVFGKNLASVLQSFLSMVVSYLLGSLLFGYPLSVAQPAEFVVTLILAVFSFIAFGLMLAPAFLLNPQIQQFQNALEYPVYVLAGFLFPIALLPFWTTPLSYILAPYWAARALQATAVGTATPNELALSWTMMAMLGIIYVVMASLLFRLVLHKARVEATLGLQ